MARTSVALVGAGSWAAAAHLPALLSLETVEVIGIVDPLIERARDLAHAHAIPLAVPSLAALFAQARPHLVLIATPTETHASLVSAALAADAAVFCEKPLTNAVPAAAELVAQAAASSTPVTVGFSFRYAPALQALHQDIRRGALGEPWLLEVFEYNPQFHPALGKAIGWKGDPAQARAGALLEYGSHIIDLAHWLVGSIDAVHASFTRVLPGSRLDDIATLQLQFRQPAIGILVAGWVLSGGVPGIKVRYHGSSGLGEAELGFSRTGVQRYRRVFPDGRLEEEALSGVQDSVSRRHLQDLLAVIRGVPSPYPHTLPSFADGWRVQGVIEAALQAITGWVHPDAISCAAPFAAQR